MGDSFFFLDYLAGGGAKVLKYLPGLRVSWDLPGFLFLNSDLTAYIDDNIGVAGGGAPETGNSFMLDLNWALPIEIGHQALALAGHAGYVGGSTDELGPGPQRFDSRTAPVHLGSGQSNCRCAPSAHGRH